MPRLFVAIDLPDAHKERLAGLYDTALPGRWTPIQQYHLTLRFIGDVTEDRAATVEKTLTRLQGTPFSLEGQGVDVFPSRRRPRVLFAALDPAPGLLTLQAQVEQALRVLDLGGDPKPFHPHVTLARLRQAKAQTVRSFLRRHETFTLAPFEVDRFYLYESVLGSEGSLHTRRAAFPLRHG